MARKFSNICIWRPKIERLKPLFRRVNYDLDKTLISGCSLWRIGITCYCLFMYFLSIVNNSISRF